MAMPLSYEEKDEREYWLDQLLDYTNYSDEEESDK